MCIVQIPFRKGVIEGTAGISGETEPDLEEGIDFTSAHWRRKRPREQEQ
jgi:hypothetical protein